jgi:hypothetical protein
LLLERVRKIRTNGTNDQRSAKKQTVNLFVARNQPVKLGSGIGLDLTIPAGKYRHCPMLYTATFQPGFG